MEQLTPLQWRQRLNGLIMFNTKGLINLTEWSEFKSLPVKARREMLSGIRKIQKASSIIKDELLLANK